MTQFTEKSFSVVQSGKSDPRRDCSTLGHWKITLHGKAVCYFCGKPCNPDGTDAREET